MNTIERNTYGINVQGFDDVIVNHLMAQGVVNSYIHNAFTSVNRGMFLTQELTSLGNSDGVVFYNKERFLIEISTIGLMLNFSDVLKNVEKVAVVGSGVGYVVALISCLGKEVIGIEKDIDLINQAKIHMSSLNIKNARFYEADFKTLAVGEKFSLIFVEGAITEPSPELIDMLYEDGEIIAVRRNNNLAHIVSYKKVNNELVIKPYKNVATPFLVGFDNKMGFKF